MAEATPQPEAGPQGSLEDRVLAVVAANGRVYAIGGEANRQPLATVEVYDAGTDAWTALAPLPTARKWLAAVVL